MLKIIVYISCFVRKMEQDELAEMKRQFTEFNVNNNIGGVLVTNGLDIFQCISGESTLIDALMERINNDKRHKQINIIYNQLIDKQKQTLSDWTMIIATNKNKCEILKCLSFHKNIISLLTNFVLNL